MWSELFQQVVPSAHLKEYLLAMQMLAVPFKERPAEHAAHQKIIANLLFEVPQGRGGSTRDDD